MNQHHRENLVFQPIHFSDPRFLVVVLETQLRRRKSDWIGEGANPNYCTCSSSGKKKDGQNVWDNVTLNNYIVVESL